jgi:hypothetical protein
MMPWCGLALGWIPLGKSITKGMVYQAIFFLGTTDEVNIWPVIEPLWDVFFQEIKAQSQRSIRPCFVPPTHVPYYIGNDTILRST